LFGTKKVSFAAKKVLFEANKAFAGTDKVLFAGKKAGSADVLVRNLAGNGGKVSRKIIETKFALSAQCGRGRRRSQHQALQADFSRKPGLVN
jgi:hypothetical protein